MFQGVANIGDTESPSIIQIVADLVGDYIFQGLYGLSILGLRGE